MRTNNRGPSIRPLIVIAVCYLVFKEHTITHNKQHNPIENPYIMGDIYAFNEHIRTHTKHTVTHKR